MKYKKCVCLITYICMLYIYIMSQKGTVEMAQWVKHVLYKLSA